MTDWREEKVDWIQVFQVLLSRGYDAKKLERIETDEELMRLYNGVVKDEELGYLLEEEEEE